jgi:hypothetical protein
MGGAVDGLPYHIGAYQNLQASVEDMFGPDDTLGLVFFEYPAFSLEIRRWLRVNM